MCVICAGCILVLQQSCPETKSKRRRCLCPVRRCVCVCIPPPLQHPHWPPTQSFAKILNAAHVKVFLNTNTSSLLRIRRLIWHTTKERDYTCCCSIANAQRYRPTTPSREGILYGRLTLSVEFTKWQGPPVFLFKCILNKQYFWVM